MLGMAPGSFEGTYEAFQEEFLTKPMSLALMARLLNGVSNDL
jgi:hypothetical protein